MPDSAQVRSAVDAAEQAATAGDFNAAARHLRDALALQERELGPAHPDVASTLNNLGVVCERIGDDAEAERCYRRACEIVTAAFPPDHPFVETSRHNLEAFCEARALPVTVPTLAGPPVNAPSPPRAIPEPPPPRPISPALERKPGRLTLVPVVAAAVVVIASVLWFNRGRGDDISTSPSAVSATRTSAPMTTPAPTPTPAPPEPAAALTKEPRPSGRGAAAGAHARARRIAGGRRGPAVPRAHAGRGVDVRARVGSGLTRPHVLLHAGHDPA